MSLCASIFLFLHRQSTLDLHFITCRVLTLAFRNIINGPRPAWLTGGHDRGTVVGELLTNWTSEGYNTAKGGVSRGGNGAFTSHQCGTVCSGRVKGVDMTTYNLLGLVFIFMISVFLYTIISF